LFGNLVNLDVTSGFTQEGYVEARNGVGTEAGVGTVTGDHYPASLIRPERRMFEPRIGVTWRPIPASTVVIKAGYGLYPDTSVYQNVILNMAQQAPLSKSLSVQNTLSCPLTLADGFTPCASVTSDTFGIDPNFRIGYAQNWQLSVQRDLPFALQMTATYSGIKGTHGPQEILPNSYPLARRIPARAARWDSPTKPRAATPSARQGNSSCGADCAVDLPRRSLTLLRNRSTTTPTSAARATRRQAVADRRSRRRSLTHPRRLRKTGSIRGRSDRFPTLTSASL
jgi:hypothetical protein